jgi:ABC-type glycerol-3-phosphate transport system substrate-binding protein
MRRFGKVVSSIVVVTLLTTTLLTGCKKDSKKTESNIKGSYVETKIELPKLEENNRVIKMEQSEKGLPILYISEEENKKVSVNSYTMQEGGEWKKDSPAWLQDIPLQDKDKFKEPKITMLNLFTDSQENQYLYYEETEDDIGMSYLCMTTDGKERTYLTFDDWNKPEKENGKTYYERPMDIEVLKNGDVMACYETEIVIYDAKSQETKDSLTGDSYSFSSIVSTDKNVFIAEVDYMAGDVTGVTSLETADYFGDKKEYKYDGNEQGYEAKLSINKDGDLILLDRGGIQVLKTGTSLWNTVVIGDGNTMSVPSAFATDMYQTKEENYYVLYDKGEYGYCLAKYQYDKDAPLPNKKIIIYTLRKNQIILEAAKKFNQEHQDVTISVRQGMSISETRPARDFIKTLNTELLSGNGPDVIVTDGLPVDAYINKSVFLDIKDIVQPMIDSGEVLDKVMESYDTNGKMYTVATRIKPLIMVGSSDVVDIANSFDGLVEASKQTWDISLLGEYMPEVIISDYMPAELNTIIEKKDGKKVINKTKLKDFLVKAQTLYNNIDGVEEYSKKYYGNLLYLPDTMKIKLVQVTAFTDIQEITAALNYVESGTIASYSNAYMGVGEVGINSSTKYPEICKEFIQFLFSEKIQALRIPDGISVNNKVLDEFIDKEDGGEVNIMGGPEIYENMEIPWLSKKDREKIVETCRIVNNRVINDKIVMEVVQKQFAEAILNETSMEDCADKIANDLNLYFSE